eukprot:TRINITY_DN35074_c0_g2_i2.p2 TRINITY_DN35074_c0_g2~~TRINITY_DN35074_c0_g2_i2.p2  ORF type:complete len:106 (-),score=21.24 TRINITY_DN35074_c0_g2_i2:14-331(-)
MALQCKMFVAAGGHATSMHAALPAETPASQTGSTEKTATCAWLKRPSVQAAAPPVWQSGPRSNQMAGLAASLHLRVPPSAYRLRASPIGQQAAARAFATLLRRRL